MPADEPPSLERLGERLERARRESTVAPPSGGRSGGSGAFGFAQAMRVAMEMVAAIGVGGAIGWFLDRWLGSAPGLLIVFVILGFAAGIRTALRAVRLIEARAEQERRK
jgi:ATP synthase protein I